MNANAPGPLRVHPNGRYFVDAGGAPFFWLGDTAWPLYTLYSRADAEAYLDDRASKGFTVIQGVAAWGNPDPEMTLPGTPAGPNYAGHLPWDKTPDRPNDAFFQHIDHLVRYAAERGLTMALWPTSGVGITETHVFNSENAYVYGLWVGKRYREQPNIIWVTGCDREPIGYEEIYRALAAGLRDGDGGAHLIGYLPCGWRSSSFYFQDETWLDFHMIQTWTEWNKVHAGVQADCMMTPARPVVLAESAYEDGPEYPMGPITPIIVRRQAWWAFMAGGFYTYGQNQNWRMEPGWHGAWNSPGAQQMGIFREIVAAWRWWATIPDQGLFASGVGSDRTLNAARRAVDRTSAMLYLSGPCHFQAQLDRIATRWVRATWIDPRSGERGDAGVYETGNGLGGPFPQRAVQCFTTPDFWEDAVLLLEGLDERP
jgi:hypothetical protein